MIVLTVLSFLVCTLYVLWTIRRGGGIPSSISATYYRIRHKWAFQIAMFLSGGLLMPALLEATPEPVEFLAFLGCAGVIIVAASPRFRGRTLEARVHTVGAVLLLLCSQILVALLTPYLLFVWVWLVVYLAQRANRVYEAITLREFFGDAKALFWAEVTTIVTTYLMLLIRL